MFDAHGVVEVAALGNDHRRVAPKDFLLAVGPRLDVIDAAFRLQELEPFRGEHVGVNVDDELRISFE